MILISNDISGLIVAFVIGHFASKGKIKWLFFGVIVNLIAGFMISGTQLFVKVWQLEFHILKFLKVLLAKKFERSSGPNFPRKLNSIAYQIFDLLKFTLITKNL